MKSYANLPKQKKTIEWLLENRAILDWDRTKKKRELTGWETERIEGAEAETKNIMLKKQRIEENRGQTLEVKDARKVEAQLDEAL